MIDRRTVCAVARPLGWLAAAALITSCATLHDPGRADAEALAHAEAAFAASAAVDGMRAAFLRAMADDATLFRPGPVNGKAYMTPRPDPPVRLEWRPQRVTVSASGELGWSTGPFRATANATPDRTDHGQFFTIWRKNASGRWEVLIDLGVGHAEPVGWQASLEVVPRDGSDPMTSIVVAEIDFARTCDDAGPVFAYRSYGATRIRLLREGSAPVDGVDRMRDLPDAGGRWTWTSGDSGTARSRDLAWTMGRYRVIGLDGSIASGTYVRVWQAERGRWRILGDVLAETERGKTPAVH